MGNKDQLQIPMPQGLYKRIKISRDKCGEIVTVCSVKTKTIAVGHIDPKFETGGYPPRIIRVIVERNGRCVMNSPVCDAPTREQLRSMFYPCAVRVDAFGVAIVDCY